LSLRTLLCAGFCWVGMGVVCCGGRTELFADNSASVGSSTDASIDAVHDGTYNRCVVDGVRLCGPGCPPVGTPDCCTAVHDRSSGAALDAGICWLDLPDKGQRECAACQDGEVCVHRSKDSLVCVPRDLCDALTNLGAQDACRFADKTPFDGRPLARPPTDCPYLVGYHWLCGGGCGDCPKGICTGRSADRAWGICMYPTGLGRQTPDNVQVCSSRASCTQSNSACIVYMLPSAADQSVANQYGFCADFKRCLSVNGYSPAYCR